MKSIKFDSDLTVNVESHFFLTSGYSRSFSQCKFQPSFLLKYVGGAPLAGDINGVFSLYDLLYFGISYRSSSVDILTQVKINSVSLGYSYEYSTNALSNFTSGSHEIVLRFQLDSGKRKFVSPDIFKR